MILIRVMWLLAVTISIMLLALPFWILRDQHSPVSDITILLSMASASDHMDHVNTQIPYAFTAATVADLLDFYL